MGKIWDLFTGNGGRRDVQLCRAQADAELAKREADHALLRKTIREELGGCLRLQERDEFDAYPCEGRDPINLARRRET